MTLYLKSPAEIELMRAGGAILARVMIALQEAAVEGTPLSDLDRLAGKLIAASGAEPSFFGYRQRRGDKPYPASLCASINEVVVHGVPTGYRLRSGDLLKIALGIRYRGWHTDGAITVGVGAVSAAAERLTAATREALKAALIQCRPGKTLGDIGAAVERTIRSAGFFVVEGLTGHGIGRALHEEPTVSNEGQPKSGLRLEPGLTLAIEPMASAGSGRIIRRPDGGYATSDGSLSAHFEHTVAITAAEPIILTDAPERSPKS